MATATRHPHGPAPRLPGRHHPPRHRAQPRHRPRRSWATPRGKIFSLPADLPIERASSRIVEEQHSRVPVYEVKPGIIADPDRIIGVVYSKDVSRILHLLAVTLSLGGAVTPSLLPSARSCAKSSSSPKPNSPVELLQEFQDRRRQIAVVVDEFGSTVGIVTAEDALEQVSRRARR